MTLRFAANCPVVLIVQLMKVSCTLAKIARTVETSTLKMFRVFCPVCFINVDMCVYSQQKLSLVGYSGPATPMSLNHFGLVRFQK